MNLVCRAPCYAPAKVNKPLLVSSLHWGITISNLLKILRWTLLPDALVIQTAPFVGVKQVDRFFWKFDFFENIIFPQSISEDHGKRVCKTFSGPLLTLLYCYCLLATKGVLRRRRRTASFTVFEVCYLKNESWVPQFKLTPTKCIGMFWRQMPTAKKNFWNEFLRKTISAIGFFKGVNIKQRIHYWEGSLLVGKNSF